MTAVELRDICALKADGVTSHMVIYTADGVEAYTDLHPTIKGAARGGLALCVDQICERHPDADRKSIENLALMLHTMNWARGENRSGQSYPINTGA